MAAPIADAPAAIAESARGTSLDDPTASRNGVSLSSTGGERFVSRAPQLDACAAYRLDKRCSAWWFVVQRSPGALPLRRLHVRSVPGRPAGNLFTINYTGNAYSNIPIITNFSSLQGMNAAKGFTVDFNDDTVSPNANLAYIFFTIDNSANIFPDGRAGRLKGLVPTGEAQETSDPNLQRMPLSESPFHKSPPCARA